MASSPIAGTHGKERHFLKLLQLCAADSSALKSWLSQTRVYTSHEVQNEMLQIMSCQIQCFILNDVHLSLWHSISADETVDVNRYNS